jgi:hypothetical protein
VVETDYAVAAVSDIAAGDGGKTLSNGTDVKDKAVDEEDLKAAV